MLLRDRQNIGAECIAAGCLFPLFDRPSGPLVSDLPADDCEIDTGFGNFRGGNCQDVLRQNDNVGELADFERSFQLFFKGGVGGIACVTAQSFSASHALFRKKMPAIFHLSGYRRIETADRVDIFDRNISAIDNDRLMIEQVAPRIRFLAATFFAQPRDNERTIGSSVIPLH